MCSAGKEKNPLIPEQRRRERERGGGGTGWCACVSAFKGSNVCMGMGTGLCTSEKVYVGGVVRRVSSLLLSVFSLLRLWSS
jgi:hypothetical protein